MPGVSSGTSTMLCCRYDGASTSDLPMKMMSLQSGSRTPEAYHLRPLST